MAGNQGNKYNYEVYTPTKVRPHRSGSLFWGLLFLFIGLVWLLSLLKIIPLNFNIILAGMVIILGIYLLVRWFTTW
ncbi:MAG: hypothetical protein ACP5RS_05310 [Thermoplasmata archaeon]